MQFTIEQMQKAKQAKSVEELLQIAKESGVELTEEQAKQYFAELHREGELTDEELLSVTGMGVGNPKSDGANQPFNQGEIVVDSAGVQYEIVCYSSSDYSHGSLNTLWYQAIVKYVPESAKVYTSYREGDTYYVNSSIVKKLK